MAESTHTLDHSESYMVRRCCYMLCILLHIDSQEIIAMVSSPVLATLAINPEGFIFSPQTGESFTANHIAIEIVQALQQGKEQDEIVRMISRKYDASDDEIETDVRDFVDHLRTMKIIGR